MAHDHPRIVVIGGSGFYEFCGCADWLDDVALPFELPGPA